METLLYAETKCSRRVCINNWLLAFARNFVCVKFFGSHPVVSHCLRVSFWIFSFSLTPYDSRMMLYLHIGFL